MNLTIMWYNMKVLPAAVCIAMLTLVGCDTQPDKAVGATHVERTEEPQQGVSSVSSPPMAPTSPAEVTDQATTGAVETVAPTAASELISTQAAEVKVAAPTPAETAATPDMLLPEQRTASTLKSIENDINDLINTPDPTTDSVKQTLETTKTRIKLLRNGLTESDKRFEPHLEKIDRAIDQVIADLSDKAKINEGLLRVLELYRQMDKD